MSRWMIEKDGTGIEKSGTGIERSGTGIEKSGTGIEKSGTGIEKSGTGIEKSGTGIRRVLLVCSLAFITFAGGIQAGNLDPAGSLQLVVNNNTVAVSWIIDGSVFSGVSSFNGSYVSMSLTEVALGSANAGTEVAGAGSGTQVAGAGSGTQVAGAGTGSQILVAGAGSGADAITITLPDGTGLAMEISLGCGSASIAVLDSSFSPVVQFDDVPVIGDTGLCSGGFNTDPGSDFRSNW